MAYDTPGALRQGLEARLLASSHATGTDLARLRRRAAFERLLVRLELNDPGRWVVKGGMAMEVRLGNRARMTRDLDLAVRDGAGGSGVHELLSQALGIDPTGDGFDFAVPSPEPLAADQLGHPGWRFHVDVRLAGRTFERVRVDVVERSDELVATERLALPDLLGFAGIESATVEATDRAQQFAEKLHALTRDYGRPNSRVRDLIDLVLLIEGGLEPDDELAETVVHVFRMRATHPLPAELGDPPSDWGDRYPREAAELDVDATTLDDALELVRSFWREVPRV